MYQKLGFLVLYELAVFLLFKIWNEARKTIKEFKDGKE